MTRDVEAEQLLHMRHSHCRGGALKSPVCHWLCPMSSWMYGGTFRTKLNQHNLKFINGEIKHKYCRESYRHRYLLSIYLVLS